MALNLFKDLWWWCSRVRGTVHKSNDKKYVKTIVSRKLFCYYLWFLMSKYDYASEHLSFSSVRNSPNYVYVKIEYLQIYLAKIKRSLRRANKTVYYDIARYWYICKYRLLIVIYNWFRMKQWKHVTLWAIFYIRAPRGQNVAAIALGQAFPRDHYCSFQNVTLPF